jgi:hypothetical protein
MHAAVDRGNGVPTTSEVQITRLKAGFSRLIETF